MDGKGLDFKHKEVININNGKRMGYVQDVCADLETGTITHIILRPGIRQHHASHGQRLTMIVIMQRLAILGKDHGERNQTSVRGGNSLDQPGNILLFLSR